MTDNYGEEAIAQLDLWVREFKFPKMGSLSVEELKALNARLLRRNNKSKKGIRINWKAFDMWMHEAERRQGSNRTVPRCLKLDPDLDSTAPCHPPPPPPSSSLQDVSPHHHHHQQQQLPPCLALPKPGEKEQCEQPVSMPWTVAGKHAVCAQSPLVYCVSLDEVKAYAIEAVLAAELIKNMDSGDGGGSCGRDRQLHPRRRSQNRGRDHAGCGRGAAGRGNERGGRCFRCGKIGHWARYCPNERRERVNGD